MAAEKKSSLGPRLALLAVVATGGIIAAVILLRPTVKVEVVGRGTAVNIVKGEVSVRASKSQPVESDVGGRLEESYLKYGMRVKAGDVLATLDDFVLTSDRDRIQNDLNAQIERRKLANAEGSSGELELNAAQAALALEEAREKAGGSSLVQVESRRRDLVGLRMRLELERIQRDQDIANNERNLALKNRDLEHTTIKANFDGEIADILAFPGAFLNPHTPIATLMSLDRIVEARISQENFASIQMGQKATVRLAGKSDIYTARVKQILPAADAATQRYTIHLEVDAPIEVLAHGLTGEVDIIVNENPEALLVPAAAVQFGAEVVVVDGGRARRRKVELGFGNLSSVAVTQGLQAGDRVVVDPLPSLIRDGQRVKVVEAEPSP